ncbi:MAG: hypothetical protein H6860_00040 [Rhodospirillales bacterium]|nr:hypothetical protein [Rhodospirillales bacterium]
MNVMSLLLEALERDEWDTKLTDGKIGEVERHCFESNSPDETFCLGKLFEQVVRQSNRPDEIPNRTLRVGLIGTPNSGKTSFFDGIINKSGKFSIIQETEHGGKRGQVVGESPSLGHVCLVDFWDDARVSDYKSDAERSKTFSTGRSEFIEHVQADHRVRKEPLHAVVVFHDARNEDDPSFRHIKILFGPELEKTQGVQEFLSDAQEFACRF